MQKIEMSRINSLLSSPLCNNNIILFTLKRNCSKTIKETNSESTTKSSWKEFKHFPLPQLDESYIFNPGNKNDIIENIRRRNSGGDLNKVLELHSELSNIVNIEHKVKIQSLLMEEILKIPNHTHPDVIQLHEEKVVKVIGEKRLFTFKPNVYSKIATAFDLLHSGNEVSSFMGHRSYFFINQLAKLESALVKHTLGKLIDKGFQVISVPDILHRKTIERCGMETRGMRHQVYGLSAEHHENDKCLSGTAEMALAGFLMNKVLSPDDLPLRLASVSRCYRAEISRTSEEKGIYRVHQFNKVEMFGVSEPEKSSELLEEFRLLQEEHFMDFGLHMRILDMPICELGAQAFRKYDIEAWLPGQEIWAEVSSCSDCIDYQSRRLAIQSGDRHVHTVNGTACALPRLIIALLETHQQSDGSVLIPQALQPFMHNTTLISNHNVIPRLQLKPIRRLRKTL